MNILVDTNIALDIVAKREPFYEKSFLAIKQALQSDYRCYFSVSSAKDVYYVMKKSSKSADNAKNAVIAVSKFATFCNTESIDVNLALISDVDDFEDAVLSETAKREDFDLILTRNAKDFVKSEIKAISPSDFLENNF